MEAAGITSAAIDAGTIPTEKDSVVLNKQIDQTTQAQASTVAVDAQPQKEKDEEKKIVLTVAIPNEEVMTKKDRDEEKKTEITTLKEEEKKLAVLIDEEKKTVLVKKETEKPVLEKTKEEEKAVVAKTKEEKVVATATKEEKVVATVTKEELVNNQKHVDFLASIMDKNTEYNVELLKTKEACQTFIEHADIAVCLLLSSKDPASLKFLYDMSKFLPKFNEITLIQFAICLDKVIPSLCASNPHFQNVKVLPSCTVFLRGKLFHQMSTHDTTTLSPIEVHTHIKGAFTLYTQQQLQQLSQSQSTLSQSQSTLSQSHSALSQSTLPNVSINASETSLSSPPPPPMSTTVTEPDTKSTSGSLNAKPTTTNRHHVNFNMEKNTHIVPSSGATTERKSNVSKRNSERKGNVPIARTTTNQKKKKAFAREELHLYGHCARQNTSTPQELENFWKAHEKKKTQKPPKTQQATRKQQKQQSSRTRLHEQNNDSTLSTKLNDDGGSNCTIM